MKRFLPASLALLTFLATWAYRNLFEATQQGAYLAGLGLHTFVGPLQPYVQVFTKLGTAPVAGASLALALVVALGAKRWWLPVQLVAFAAGLLGTVQVLKTRLPYLPQGGINGTGYFPHYNTMPSGHAAMILVATVPLMAALSATKLPRIFKRIAFVGALSAFILGTTAVLVSSAHLWTDVFASTALALFWAYLLLPLQQVQYKKLSQPYVRLTLITFAIAWVLLHVDQALQTNNKFGLAFCAFSLCAGAFIALLSQVSPGNSQETIN